MNKEAVWMTVLSFVKGLLNIVIFILFCWFIFWMNWEINIAIISLCSIVFFSIVGVFLAVYDENVKKIERINKE